ncbi:ABC transporter permease [Paenibacillus sediminis]|uniref:Transport permease protein n=1 Tax=Paenibacillus sediminis TaxID=664909 RepID=A0ABS4H398_9BACL|nr:ABC transporter permease [Paenibacillus sediminis]MBP1937005.1 ABC-2 type transport system permease protein [Paenibacillus sediminis]
MKTIFRSMLITSLRDPITLFYSILFPIGLLIGLGLYFDSPDYQFRLLTGVLALSTLFWGVSGIAFQVHQQRNRGVYKLLRLTPFPAISFILTMTLVRTLLGLMINAIVFVTGVLVFDIEAELTTILLLLLNLAAGTLCMTAFGFFISNLARNEGQINMISNLFYIPMVFGTDMFYSLQGAPHWLKTAGQCFPLGYLVKGLRASFTGWAKTLPNIAIVAAYIVLFLLIALFTFRWEAEQKLLSSPKRRTA